MMYQTEAKLQGWRALAVFEDRSERLIFVGRSTTQVRAGYAGAFAEVLDDEEQAQVRTISLQCWQGAPDQGKWVAKGTLTVPGARKPAAAAGRAKAVILSFRDDADEDADLPAAPAPAKKRLATTA